MNVNNVRADFGGLEGLAAEERNLAGNVDGIRAAVRQHAQQALTQLGGGMGTEQHEACMREVDRLIDEYLNSTRQLETSTQQVSQRFREAGTQAQRFLSSGA